jgi:hypothetical protein
MNLGSLGTSSKGKTRRFHKLGSVQWIKVELDKHRRDVIMFQHVTKYNVHMTNILLRPFNLEINNKQIIKEKDMYVQNLK